ncbi:hypothetical protein X975_12521, partial [Stegodyphus mimosarum]
MPCLCIANSHANCCDGLNYRGGGVMIYIYKNFPSCLISVNRANNCEQVTVCATLPTYKNVYFSALYNPPQNRLNDSTLYFLLPPVIVVGDLNAKNVAWNC